MAVSACDFIDGLLPEIFIDKVTLETKGGSYAQPYDDPHIDESATYLPIYKDDGSFDSYHTASMSDDIFQAISDDPRTLCISIEAHVKELITGGGNSTVGSWFANEDFTKYFNVSLYAYTDPIKFAYAAKHGPTKSYTVDRPTIHCIKNSSLVTYDRDSLDVPALINEEGSSIVFEGRGADMIGLSGQEYSRTSISILEGTVGGVSGSDDGRYLVVGDGALTTDLGHGGTAFVGSANGKYEIGIQDYINDTYDITKGTEINLSDLFNWGITSNHSSGGTLFKLPISKVMDDYNNTEPAFLGVIAIASLDVHQMEEDYEIDFNLSGVISSEGSAEADITAGTWHAVEVIKNGVISGKDNTTPSVDITGLETEEVEMSQNYVVISDMRVLDKLEKQEFDVGSVNYTLSTGFATAKDFTYVSDVYMSFDHTHHQARGIFTINWHDLLRDHSIYGKALDNSPGSAPQMRRRCPIVEMTVFRERIDSSFGHKDVYDKERMMTYRDATYRGGSTGDWAAVLYNSPVTQTSTVNVGGEDKAVFSMREIFLNIAEHFNPDSASPIRTIRHFEFVDHSSSSLSKGTYRYSIRMRVRDGIREWLGYRLSQLRTQVENLEKYYEFSTQSRYYNARTNMFREGFQSAMESHFNGESAAYPWNVEDGNLFNALNIVKDLFAVETTNTLVTFPNIAGAIDPTNGSPQGIGILLTAVQDVLQKGMSIVGDVTPKSPGSYEGDASPTDMQTNSPVSFFEIEHSFATEYEADIPRGNGVAFVSTIIPGTGIPYVNKTTYLDSSNPESKRYIDHRGPQWIHLNTGLSTGTAVNMVHLDDSGVLDYATYSNNLHSSGLHQALLRNMANCSEKSSGGLLPHDKDSNRTYGEDLADAELSFITESEAMDYFRCSIRDTAAGASTDPASATIREEDVDVMLAAHIDPSSTGGTGVSVELYEQEALANISARNCSLLSKSHFSENAKGIDMAMDFATDDSAPGGYVVAGTNIKMQENISGRSSSSLIVDAVTYWNSVNGANSIATNLFNLINFSLKYTTIGLIEYLDSYEDERTNEESTGQYQVRPCLQNPNWKLLTADALENIGTGRQILCRVREYSESNRGIVYPKSICLPIYNRYFLIKG